MKAQINLHRMGRLGHSGWRGWEKQLKKNLERLRNRFIHRGYRYRGDVHLQINRGWIFVSIEVYKLILLYGGIHMIVRITRKVLIIQPVYLNHKISVRHFKLRTADIRARKPWNKQDEKKFTNNYKLANNRQTGRRSWVLNPATKRL